MQRRTLRILAATAALALTATACGGGGGGGGGAQEANAARGPITIWYSNNEQELPGARPWSRPGTPTTRPSRSPGQEIPAGKSSEEVIGAAITAGTAPCLVLQHRAVGRRVSSSARAVWSTWRPSRRRQAYIEERSGDVADQYKAPDGGYYQLPWKSNPVMIFYNKDALRQGRPRPGEPEALHLRGVPGRGEARSRIEQGRRRTRSTRHRRASSSRPSSTSCRSYAAADRGQGPRRGRQGDLRRPERASTSPTFWKTLYDRGPRRQGDRPGRRVRRREGRHGHRRPVGHRGLQGQDQLGLGAGADQGRDAGGGDLHLQRRQEHRPVHRLHRTRAPPGTC